MRGTFIILLALAAFIPAFDANSEEEPESLKHGEKCGKKITGMCDKAAGLTCDKEEGVCSCKKSDDVFYHEESEMCLTKIGRNCTFSTICEKNSICSPDLSTLEKKNYNRLTQRNPYELINMKCTCMPGYILNSQGHCIGSHTASCSDENPCNTDTFLECIDGTCQCQAGSHQIFTGKGNGTCQLMVHSTCKDDSTGPQCTENSKCVDGTCKCEQGFSQAPSGKCLATFKTECANQEKPKPAFSKFSHREAMTLDIRVDVTSPSILESSCNVYEGLGCLNNKCICFDNNLVWDEGRNACVAGENEKCGPIKKVTSVWPYEAKSYYYVACAGKMKCQKEYNGIEGWNICVPK